MWKYLDISHNCFRRWCAVPSRQGALIRRSNLKNLAVLHVVQVIGVDRSVSHIYLIGGTPREEMTGAMHVQAFSTITRQR